MHTRTSIIILFFGIFATISAQQAPSISPLTTTVPRVVRVSNTFHPANGLSASPVEGVVLALYRDEHGGVPLWQETQNVSVDSEGRYSVLMGSTISDGMPLELFKSGEPRWLGVQFNRPGEVEQPRVLLTSVPYALKAVDAETLGGLPASAYMLSPSGTASGTPPSVAPSMAAAKSLKPHASSGSTNYVPVFTDNTGDLGNSAIYSLNGNIGINTTNPLISVDARTGPFPQMGMAQTTDYLSFFASDTYGPAIYWDPAKDMRFGKGGSGLYNPYGFVEQMRIQSSTGNVGIGTMAPASKLDVAGDINFTGSLLFKGSTTNAALGSGALAANTANGNTAVGSGAMQTNTVGTFNTGVGQSALLLNTSGSGDTAVGVSSLQQNTGGLNNTATGAGSLGNNSTGNNNVAFGYNALTNINTGSGNLAIGYQAGLSLTGANANNIEIGSTGVAGDNGVIRLGSGQTKFFAAGISGVTIGTDSGAAVVIDANGQLGTVLSSRRFKEDIQDMGSSSSGLMQLRPVTFRYKQPFADGSKPMQYGLIAEEVEEVYPDLVVHSADGQVQTVKYQVLDSMLLNEVQRQQREIGSQKEQIRLLQERLAKLETAMDALSNGPRVP